MGDFRLVSDYTPKGDQPSAIESLVEGVDRGEIHQVLLGVTGSGKTFTIANVIQRVNRPVLVISHNKTLAAQLASEFKTFFPQNAVYLFITTIAAEAYVPQTDTYIEKDATINDELTNSDTRHKFSSGKKGRLSRNFCVVHLWLGSPCRLQGPHGVLAPPHGER